MTSRSPSSTSLSALLDRPGSANATGNAPTGRSAGSSAGNGSDFQSLLAGGRRAHPLAENAGGANSKPSGADAAHTSQPPCSGDSPEPGKRKTRDAAEDVSELRPVNTGAPQTAPGAANAAAAGSAAAAAGGAGAAVAAAAGAASNSSRCASAPSGAEAAGAPGASAGSATAGASAGSGARASSGASLAPAAADSAMADSVSPALQATPNERMRPDAERGAAAAETPAAPETPARTSQTTQNASPGAPLLTDPEQQLLAWLSGTDLQPGTAGTTGGAGPAGAAPSTTNSPAGPTASGPAGAEAAAAQAVAQNLPKSSSGIDSTQSTTGSAAAAPSDAAHTGSLTLLSTNVVPGNLAAAAHTQASQPLTGALQSPLGTSAWVEELGAQLSWMANQGMESASLHVSPAELGPIEVRIAVHGSDASIWFGAAQATTRAALEQALPQLRQLLANHGLALADAGVFREPPRGSARHAAPRPLAPAGAVSAEIAPAAEATTAVRLGLLDLYA